MNILQEHFSSEKTNVSTIVLHLNYNLDYTITFVFVCMLQYDELFWEVMMPEWSVALFMSSFNMDREEAINRINLQIQISEARLEESDDL